MKTNPMSNAQSLFNRYVDANAMMTLLQAEREPVLTPKARTCVVVWLRVCDCVCARRMRLLATSRHAFDENAATTSPLTPN